MSKQTPISRLITKDAQAKPNPELVVRPARRQFTAQYKLDVLNALDRASPEEHSAIMRREGLYSSRIHEWRKARSKGSLSALGAKRGRPVRLSPQEKQIEELKRENLRLKKNLSQAEAIIDIQKKVSEIFGKKI